MKALHKQIRSHALKLPSNRFFGCVQIKVLNQIWNQTRNPVWNRIDVQIRTHINQKVQEDTNR